MNLSLSELNDLYYCVGKVSLSEGIKLIDDEVLENLLDKLRDEINNKVKDSQD